MDTSGEYILMCKQAEEVQKIWELSNGDFYFNPKRKDKKCIVILGGWLNSITTFEGFNQYNYTWLPRQDQIQEICGIKKPFDFLWIDWLRFCVLPDWTINAYAINFDSMEQLWLAFLMQQKYNKQWNGETWIEIKKW